MTNFVVLKKQIIQTYGRSLTNERMIEQIGMDGKPLWSCFLCWASDTPQKGLGASPCTRKSPSQDDPFFYVAPRILAAKVRNKRKIGIWNINGKNMENTSTNIICFQKETERGTTEATTSLVATKEELGPLFNVENFHYCN